MVHLRSIACLAALLGGPPGNVAAQDSLPATPKFLGRILILEGERCLEGDVEAADDRYCLRQGGSEIWVPAKSVLRVCPDWRAAYEFMKTRADLGDPDERLRLARWCQTHQQLPFALVEAKAAQEMRPSHPESRSLVAVLQKTLTATKDMKPVVPKLAEPGDAMPALDLNAEATALFATRIQPILLNTCVSCHGTHTAGKSKFQLYRSVEGGQRGAMQRNLKAVLTFVNFDRPEASPILDKAVSDHGLAKTAPLPGKKSAPYQSLEHWVRAVVATHPHLRERLAPPPLATASGSPALPRGDGDGFATAAAPKVESPFPPKETPRPPHTSPLDAKKAAPPLPFKPEAKLFDRASGTGAVPKKDAVIRPEPPAPAAAPPAAEHDPFDPTPFNRLAHPARK